MENKILLEQKILLVGCGKMGSSLLAGLIKAGVLPKHIIVIEPNTAEVHNNFNVKVLKHFDQSEIEGFNPDVVIFAVKPQTIEEILPHYKEFAGHSLFISVIAGKTIAFFEKHLGNNVAVIRTMPNLPVAVGEGVIVASKNKNVTEDQQNIVNQLFGTLGTVYGKFVEEKLLDMVTAISGSGPAYVFYFMECLLEAAVKLGLPEDLAIMLVNNTVRGSSGLAIKSAKSAAQLRIDVTSPAGTTEAALNILMKNEDMQKLMIDATSAACNRSKELSE